MDSVSVILPDQIFWACLDVLLVKGENFQEPVETHGSFLPLMQKGQDFTQWFFRYSSGFHCLFHLLQGLPSPCTIATLDRKYLLLWGPEQLGTAPRHSSCQRGLFQRWEVLSYLNNGKSPGIRSPALSLPHFQHMCRVSELVPRTWWVLGFYFFTHLLLETALEPSLLKWCRILFLE